MLAALPEGNKRTSAMTTTLCRAEPRLSVEGMRTFNVNAYVSLRHLLVCIWAFGLDKKKMVQSRLILGKILFSRVDPIRSAQRCKARQEQSAIFLTSKRKNQASRC